MDGIRGFLLVKTSVGKEKELMNEFAKLPEVHEVHLITGKFDLLVAMESEEALIDPRRKIVETVVEKVRKFGGIEDTRTILPTDSDVKREPIVDDLTRLVRAFVFVYSETGKERDLMRKISELPEVREVHLIPGKADLLTVLEVRKSLVHPFPHQVADIVTNKIVKIGDVRDTDTFTPIESIHKH